MAIALAASFTSARAAQFSPANTHFTLSGTLYLSTSPSVDGFSCPFKFVGKVTGHGTIEISKANFCKKVHPESLPWTWQATGVHPRTGLAPMTFSIKSFDCGEDNDEIITSDGTFHMTAQDSANECVIGGGYGLSTPAIVIVK
jgi:hypothetical protein